MCKKEVSLANYEDETAIGFASILHITYIHHNFTDDTIHVVLFRKTTLISTIRTHEKIIKRV